jgi:hypothetical protein
MENEKSVGGIIPKTHDYCTPPQPATLQWRWQCRAAYWFKPEQCQD